jgi:hypothetical protein
MPTPSPIIVARVEATLGTWTTCSSIRMIESEQARPMIAEEIGRTIAVAVPKAKRRMTIAAAIPIASLAPVSGLESCWPT